MELPRFCHRKFKIEALATGCAVVKFHCLPFTLGHIREDAKEIVRTSLTMSGGEAPTPRFERGQRLSGGLAEGPATT